VLSHGQYLHSAVAFLLAACIGLIASVRWQRTTLLRIIISGRHVPSLLKLSSAKLQLSYLLPRSRLVQTALMHPCTYCRHLRAEDPEAVLGKPP
jgi:hypothetical protein